MKDQTDLLRLTQWLSPAFPVSSYAYSHGLEAAIAAGEVRDGCALLAWLETVLRAGAGRNDAILLCLALRGELPEEELADLAAALAGSAERLEETRAQGAAFAATISGMEPDAVAALPYPVAVGVAARRLSLPLEQVAQLYLHAFASNLVSAAVRFVPLGQVEGQRVLAMLHPVLAEIAAEAAPDGPEGLGGAAFGADISAMAHEGLEVRIFRT